LEEKSPDVANQQPEQKGKYQGEGMRKIMGGNLNSWGPDQGGRVSCDSSYVCSEKIRQVEAEKGNLIG